MSQQNQSPLSEEEIVEFIDTRRAIKDFSFSGSIIRVETEIRAYRSPWTLRSVVLQDGKEIREGFFSPIEEQFEVTGIDPKNEDNERRILASKALRCHQARCERVEDALSEGGVEFGGRRRAVGSIFVAATVVLVLSLGCGAAFMLRQDPASPVVAAKSAQSATVEVASVPLGPGDDAKGPEPIEYRLESTEGLSAPGAQAAPGGNLGNSSTTMPGGSRTQEDLSRQSGAGGSEASVRGELPLRSARANKVEVFELPESSDLIDDIEPSYYEVGVLAAGESAYVDGSATIVEVPEAYSGLYCIRTAQGDQTLSGSISFNLAGSGRVYVGHDRRVRKKPQWLQAFSRTGRSVAIGGAEGEEAIYLDLFVQEQSAGRVVLGPNTEWSSVTRILRSKIPKNLSMYIVCVEPR